MARPEFQPTAAQRRQVSLLAAAKMPEARIAAVLGITRPTLRKHFADELTQGKAQRNAAVVQAIYKQAVSGNVSAQRLWVKIAGLDLPDFDAPEDAKRSSPSPSRTAKEKPQGKKELAKEAAMSAGVGTDWGDDLSFSGKPN